MITIELLKAIIDEIALEDNIGAYVYVNDLWEYIEERNV